MISQTDVFFFFAYIVALAGKKYNSYLNKLIAN